MIIIKDVEALKKSIAKYHLVVMKRELRGKTEVLTLCKKGTQNYRIPLNYRVAELSFKDAANLYGAGILKFADKQ